MSYAIATAARAYFLNLSPRHIQGRYKADPKMMLHLVFKVRSLDAARSCRWTFAVGDWGGGRGVLLLSLDLTSDRILGRVQFAKVMAPSVIYVDELEKIFPKKKSKVEGEETPSRIKKFLEKVGVSCVPDRVVWVGAGAGKTQSLTKAREHRKWVRWPPRTVCW